MIITLYFFCYKSAKFLRISTWKQNGCDNKRREKLVIINDFLPWLLATSIPRVAALISASMFVALPEIGSETFLQHTIFPCILSYWSPNFTSLRIIRTHSTINPLKNSHGVIVPEIDTDSSLGSIASIIKATAVRENINPVTSASWKYMSKI